MLASMSEHNEIPADFSGLSVHPEAALVPPERMEAPRLSGWKRFWGHLHTVNTHRRLVRQLCFRAGLYRQGLTHDLSKYSLAEFSTGVKYFQGWRSPNAAERDELGYSGAWLHHKGRNRHHFEYWTDIMRVPDETGMGELKWSPIRMPVRYVVEMFCDRIAASKVYLKDAYTDESALIYFRREVGSAPQLLHPETYELIERLLVMLAEEGEDAVFAYIRHEVIATGDGHE